MNRVLPKTDNTYSPGSKYYKYEVSPGIPFIPNMSRLPLKSYEKTPLKYDFLKDSIDYNFISSHISKYIFCMCILIKIICYIYTNTFYRKKFIYVYDL